jgi:hypothetical protein
MPKKSNSAPRPQGDQSGILKGSGESTVHRSQGMQPDWYKAGIMIEVFVESEDFHAVVDTDSTDQKIDITRLNSVAATYIVELGCEFVVFLVEVEVRINRR